MCIEEKHSFHVTNIMILLNEKVENSFCSQDRKIVLMSTIVGSFQSMKMKNKITIKRQNLKKQEIQFDSKLKMIFSQIQKLMTPRTTTRKR